MTIGYGMIHESFTTGASRSAPPAPSWSNISTGRSRFLENRWHFQPDRREAPARSRSISPMPSARACSSGWWAGCSPRRSSAIPAPSRRAPMWSMDRRRSVSRLTAMSSSSVSARSTLRPPDLAASEIAEQHPLMHNRLVAPAGGEMHKPNRLLRRSAVGPGDAGDGDGKVRVRMGERASGHGARHVLAHRAVPLDQPNWHAEHLALGRVRIGNEAALENVRRAGNGGERARRPVRRCRIPRWR